MSRAKGSLKNMHSTTMNFNDGGRPLFAHDADKHLTPGPGKYKPERFRKYDLRTKLSPYRASIPNEIRFRDFEE